MPLARWAMRGCLLIAVLTLGSCVVLSGQRIGLRYDQPADRLDILVFYDGIHDDAGRTFRGGRDGAEQIAEFVADGDVMLLDWIGHVQMSKIAEAVDDQNTPAAVSAFCRAVLGSMKTQPVGHYRDLDGRIGAVQAITIADASKFVDKANAAINHMVLSGLNDAETDSPWRRSHALMRAACAAGHPWIDLDGHALRVTVPLDHREWTTIKTKYIKQQFTELIDVALGEGGREKANENVAAFLPLLQLAGAAPIGVRESPRQVVFTLGDPNEPTLLRTRMTDRQYNEQLEPAVTKHIDQSLDAMVMDRLTAEEGAKPMPVIDAIIEWGPPEATARVLAREAVGGNEDAARRLGRWAEHWNRESGVPEAPAVRPGDSAAFIEAWTDWYDRMTHFPLPLPELPAPTAKPQGEMPEPAKPVE